FLFCWAMGVAAWVFVSAAAYKKAEVLVVSSPTARRLAGSEYCEVCDTRRLKTAVAAAGGNALGAEHQSAVAGLALADAAEGADPAILPGAGHNIGAFGAGPHYRFAAGAHDSEQRFHAVDAVPEEIGMMFLDGTRAIRHAAEDLAHLGIVPHFEDSRAEAQGRAGEDRHLVFLGEVIDLQGVGQRAGHRLINKAQLAGFE